DLLRRIVSRILPGFDLISPPVAPPSIVPWGYEGGGLPGSRPALRPVDAPADVPSPFPTLVWSLNQIGDIERRRLRGDVRVIFNIETPLLPPPGSPVIWGYDFADAS